MAGHYFDVRVGDSEWKLAKIVDRDKRYAVVIYDGVNSREEVISLAFSKSCFTAGKLRPWDQTPKATPARPIRPIEVTSPPSQNIKQYHKQYIASRNTATNLSKRTNTQCIHHHTVSKGRTLRSSPRTACEGRSKRRRRHIGHAVSDWIHRVCCEAVGKGQENTSWGISASI